MSNLTFDRHGISVSELNDLSLVIRLGISGNLHEDYKSQIDALQLYEEDGFNENVEHHDSLLPLWGWIIKSANIGLITNTREHNEYVRLQIYTTAQVDIDNVIIGGGELLLRVTYLRADRSLTYTRFWR